MAMNVDLSEQFEQYIAEQVKSGLYNNASEVIREALRLKMQQDQTYQAKLEALRADIDVACKQLDDGRGVQYDPKEMLNRVKRKTGQ